VAQFPTGINFAIEINIFCVINYNHLIQTTQTGRTISRRYLALSGWTFTRRRIRRWIECWTKRWKQFFVIVWIAFGAAYFTLIYWWFMKHFKFCIAVWTFIFEYWHFTSWILF